MRTRTNTDFMTPFIPTGQAKIIPDPPAAVVDDGGTPDGNGMLDDRPPLQFDQAAAGIPWMDQSLITGVKNRLLVYGAGGLTVLALAFVVLRKKSSVAGYRRRRSRR